MVDLIGLFKRLGFRERKAPAYARQAPVRVKTNGAAAPPEACSSAPAPCTINAGVVWLTVPLPLT